LAILVGVTPALKAARTALNFPGVNETAVASTDRLLGILSGRRFHVALRPFCDNSREQLVCLIAVGRSLGKTCRETATVPLLLFDLGEPVPLPMR
jgi:hypothetical protein